MSKWQPTLAASSAVQEKTSGGPHIVKLAAAPRECGDTAKSAAANSGVSKPAGTIHLESVKLSKRYQKGRVEIPVLRGANLRVHRGEMLSIIGHSGSGKSTLLHLLGTLDQPDGGEVWFNERRIDNLPARQRDHIRNRMVGFIFQFYHLLPELTALQNVLLPLMIREGAIGYFRRRREHMERAKALLETVQLSHRLTHKPRELSGGEMQRAAIARALITQPEVLLADEPTGNLDRQTGQEILALLRSLNRQQNLTIVMVTHDLTIAQQADRAVRLVEGQVTTA